MSVQLHEWVETARPTATIERLPAMPALPRRWRTRIAHAGRLGLVWLPAYIFSLGELDSLVVAVIAATALTLAWLAATRTTLAALRASRPALGRSGSAAVTAAAGAASASVLGLWAPWLSVGPANVLRLAACVLVLSIAWEKLAGSVATDQRRVLIVGASDGGEELIEELWASGDQRFEVVGIVDDEHAGETIAGVRVLGGLADLPEIAAAQRPDLVVLALTRNRLDAMSSLLDAADSRFEALGLAEFHEQAFGRVPVRHLNAAWFMSVLHFYRRPYGRFAKRAFDLGVAGTGLLLTAPLFPLIALLVRRTPGPIVFKQRRLGEGGRMFTMYKFRTMRADAEEGVARWAEERDPRATPTGKFLRRTRLDELPQLWNVLKGEMSVVGPRPERPEFMADLESAVPFWTRRHLVKPGLTGWAQVRRGYTADAEGTADKLSYDLWYLRHRSLLIDLAICARTFGTLLSGTGAR